MTSSHTPVPSVPVTASGEDHEALYQLVKRAEINPHDVEDVSSLAVEVTVLWQRSVLHVAHLQPGQSFTLTSVSPVMRAPSSVMLPGLAVGAAVMLAGAMGPGAALASVGAIASAASVGAGIAMHRKNERALEDVTRFVVDADMLGADEVPVVRAEAGGARFLFRTGATGEIEIDGVRRSLSDVTEQELTAPSSVDGVIELALRPGGRYRVDVGGLTVCAKVVNAGRKALVGSRRDPALGRSAIGASIGLAALVTAMRFASREDGMLTAEDRDARMAELRSFLDHNTSRTEARQDHEAAANAGSQEGRAHQGEAGAMGPRDVPNRHRHYELPRNNQPVNVGHQSARETVANLGIFHAMGPSVPTQAMQGLSTMFGQMTASGDADRLTAGNLDGEMAGESGGYGGLDTLGSGWGGGGDRDGLVGVGQLDTVGRSGHCPPGQDCRYGETHGNIHLRAAQTHGPQVRSNPATVVGINGDVIRRVVQRNISQVNHCYEQGLRDNPRLAGRVSVFFVIAGGGSVLTSQVRESSLDVPSVAACIAGAVQRWTFPVPEDSSPVRVTYPFSLMPADQ